MDFTNNQIDLEQLPATEDILYVSVEEKYKKVLYGGYLLLWGIPVLASAGSAIFFPEKRIFMLVLSAFLLVLMLFMLLSVNRIYGFLGYALRENDACLRYGLFFRKYLFVPFNRIQHISVEEGILARAFGLASLKIYTAAGDNNHFVLKGITKVRAEEMKQFILQKIKTDDSN